MKLSSISAYLGTKQKNLENPDENPNENEKMFKIHGKFLLESAKLLFSFSKNCPVWK
jgi:hypothetical protein